MNFIHRNDHLGSYRRVNTDGIYRLPNHWSQQFQSSIHSDRKPRISRRRKGTLTDASNNWLSIVIGGDNSIGKKRKKSKHSYNRIKTTKYSLLSFLPRNLLEQFRRIANFYFLLMTIIGCIIDGPVSPMTSLIPLVFVISVTGAKQGYEDYLRYKTDKIVNHSPVTVIRNGVEQNISCEDVLQGDLVLIYRDCDVPCDLVLLQSSDISGKCFITTANLDGESNLKTLLIPRGLSNQIELSQLQTIGTIECELPKFDLYSFAGKIILNPLLILQQSPEQVTRILPLTTENLLLRGSRIKNTEYVIGCAVYTGMNTKLQLNSRLTRNKVASSEMYVNKFLTFVLILLIIIATFCFFLKRSNEMTIIQKHNYLGDILDTTKISVILQDYLSFVILFNYIIPISLYVTIEMNRILGGFFMEWDYKLYDEQTDQQCIVNTSNLNEELGQVNILFSDKTGTLTKNEMIFQQCSINCKRFIYKKTKLQETSSTIQLDINKFNEEQRIFFHALALCHTVQVAGDINTSGIENNLNNIGKMTKQQSKFPNITEENHNNNNNNNNNSSIVQNSPTNCNQLSSDEADSVLTPTLVRRNNMDINPLLMKTSLEEKRNRIVKRSPKFARSSRIHPLTIGNSDSILDEHISSRNHNKNGRLPPSMITPPTPLENFRNQNPFHFHRSTSQIDLPASTNNYNNSTNSNAAHRRTQSYGASPNTQQRNSINLLRTPSGLSTRESYAVPNYIISERNSLLRMESQRRKKEIQSVVEKLDYQASSPDEKALLEACANLGYVYLGDNDDILKIQICPPHLDYSKPYSLLTCKEISYKRLHTIEFTSDRKRMSVIVQDSNDEIWIITKGAESYVFPLCSSESTEIIEKTNNHISEFAMQGLRTLAVARRKLTKNEYEEFQQELTLANQSLTNRKYLIDLCNEKIEKNLTLLGATAVEDALQDDVHDTLIALQKAGMKIWVLTGDKIETALNIAISCGHIQQNSYKYFIVECKRKEDLEMHLNILETEINRNIITTVNAALLIDGKSLEIALKCLPERFRDVAICCQAVLCCRLSPLQKCEVVQLIKTSKKHNYITAAIGDGANDVSMIQEAHVGIGIVGKEGRQAARCADFAFANFNMLPRLFLLHGHYHTSRLSFLVLYFFYKEIVFMGIQFLFQFHSLFSSGSIYDSLFLTLYNVVYTACPIWFISLTEKPYSEDQLIQNPELYKRNINNKALHWKNFISWILIGVYHTFICFYMTFYVFSMNNSIFPNGDSADYSCFGILLIQNVVVVVNFKLWLETTYQSYIYLLTIWGSILAFTLTTYIYNIINIRYDTDIYATFNNLLACPVFYILSILVIVASLLPDYTYRIGKLALNMPKIQIFPNNAKSKLQNKFHRHIITQQIPVESTAL